MSDEKANAIVIWPTRINNVHYVNNAQVLLRCDAVEYMVLDEDKGAVTFALRGGDTIEASASETSDCAFAVFGFDFVE